ncbi:hypothetical protein AcV5_009169 [Taiwanofungus camphoratus]|nr:hypothetical protein AcV5_009169 [Antrodia cinnamomea]KAI0924465.1 hypothetical protein AcW2_005344 [Antrodia cinnamomea]KAI0940691.1 hypothetical protein AcV7_003002 [Antrodia cinnamomea]
MEETIIKRLHISGLNSSISATDLSQRLGMFGSVKALDGFGLVDAVGQPRKFGYVTLETTKSKLARCLNLLSGVVWKGAKLRIGEAKPDFRERIARENAAFKRSAPTVADAEPPKKRRRLPRGVQGVHAADMSLVTSENAASRSGWRVTPLGRLIRPIRMRPEHPLADPLPASAKAAKDKKVQKVRSKKRLRDPLIRARRRTIDPTKWGSQHLKGVFLEASGTSMLGTEVDDARGVDVVAKNSDSDEPSDDEEDIEGQQISPSNGDGNRDTTPVAEEVARPSPVPPPLPASKSSNISSLQQGRGVDLAQEKQESLGLLQALFGDKGDAEWGGEESIDSDVEVDIEDSVRQYQELSQDAVPETAVVDEGEEAVMEIDKSVTPGEELQRPATQPPAAAQVQTTKLKDLFVPREEDAGFSLLGHLDLDLDLDDEVDLQFTPQGQSRPGPQLVDAAPPLVATADTPIFDPKRPMFFPLPPDMRGRGRVQDVLDPTNWRTWFFRTESAEEIQKRWEEARGELTRGWKRRHREAVKSRRRRGGGPGDGET